MPDGKGMPSKIPNGIISNTANKILPVMGKAMAWRSNGGRKKLANKSNTDKLVIEIRKVRYAFKVYFPEIHEPHPVNNKSAASTMAKVYTGFPNNKLNNCIITISIIINPQPKPEK